MELIEGGHCIVALKMNIESRGSNADFRCTGLGRGFGPDHWVRVQASLDLSPIFRSGPRLAVIPGQPEELFAFQSHVGFAHRRSERVHAALRPRRQGKSTMPRRALRTTGC